MEQEYKLAGRRTLKIKVDEYQENPRKVADQFGTFVGNHSRYDIFDEKASDGIELALVVLTQLRSVDSHRARKDALFLSRAIYDENVSSEALTDLLNKVAIVLPVYMYDHSGVTIATTPFPCRWDSGQVGVIFVTKAKAMRALGESRVTKKFQARVEWYLNSEIELLDAYVTGEVFGFEIVDENGEVEDSCWGFYGANILLNGILEHLDPKDRKTVRKEASKLERVEEKSEKEAQRRFRKHVKRIRYSQA